jgi:glycosyltransferase involved in cell wall biosynthesis
LQEATSLYTIISLNFLGELAISISVIIPFFDTLTNLQLCLESIELQGLGKFEIIVVNNSGSTIRIEKRDNLRIINSDFKSSYRGRNLGVKEAVYNNIAFIDSDCVASKEWLNLGNSSLLSNPHSIFSGPIKFKKITNDKKSSLDIYQELFEFDHQLYLNKLHFSATANMFITKEIFNQLGGFCEYQNVGADSAFGYKARGMNIQVLNCKNAIVFHQYRNKYKNVIYKSLKTLLSGHLNLTKNNFLHTVDGVKEIHSLRPLHLFKEKVRFFKSRSLTILKKDFNFFLKLRLFVLLCIESIVQFLGMMFMQIPYTRTVLSKLDERRKL